MKSRLPLWCAVLGVLGVSGWAIARRVPSARQSPLSAAAPPQPQRPPYDRDAVHQNLEFYAKQVVSDPQSAIFQASLSNCYLESYRETGDAADVVGAEKAARASLKLRPVNNGGAYFQLSRALVAQHRFREALQAARNAARYSRTAFRQCADIQVEIGDYEAARRDLGRSPFQKDDPAYLALQARFLEIGGNNAGARQLLQRAAAQAEANLDVPPQSVAWFWERLGHIQFQNGEWEAAKASYGRALQVFPRDYRTMAALSRLYAARGEWKDCLLWGERAAAIVPAPDTIALLGDAYAARGARILAAQKYALVDAMERLSRSQGVVYDRQRALFYANRRQKLPVALQLARGELRQRHDIYAFDTLAWIYFQMGRLEEAQRASDQALRFKTGDAMLWYHAGLIADARGQKARARADLERALQLNSHFLLPADQNRARQILARL